MRRDRVVVIGAGMAGIAAARTLHDAGHTVIVLEGRDRIGGRTHTDRSLGAPVDLGAAWIHGIDGNPMTELADRWGIAYGFTDFLNRSGDAVQAYDADGTPLDMAGYTRGQLLANAGFLKATASLLAAPPPPEARSLRAHIAHGLPRPAALSRSADLGFHYWSVVRTEYSNAADWDTIDWVLGRDYVTLPGGDHLLYGGGYNAITDRLVDGLDIRLGRTVRRVRVRPDGVTVETDDATLTAGHVIVTVPLGVLQAGAIAFDPPLPAAKRAAIGRIGYGNYEKFGLLFDDFYWPRDRQRFNFLSDGEPPLFNAWLNVGYYTGRPILVAYHAGRRARTINAWSDGDLLARTLRTMETLFGGPIPPPLATARTGWQHDPFALGSYSFDRVGQRPADRRVLARPVDERLFFAGEATHPHFYATVHGAYETGVRAAREVEACSV